MAIDKKELKGKSKDLLIYMIEILEASRDSLAKVVKAREKELLRTLPLPLGRDGQHIFIGDTLVREDGTCWRCVGVLHKKDEGTTVMVESLEKDTPYARSLFTQFLPPKQFSHTKRKKPYGD